MTLTPEAAKTVVPAETLTQEETIASLGRYGYGWSDSDVAGASAQRGLSEAVVRDISAKKSEPEWMLNLRLKGLRLFDRKPMPSWGADLTGIRRAAQLTEGSRVAGVDAETDRVSILELEETRGLLETGQAAGSLNARAG